MENLIEVTLFRCLPSCWSVSELSCLFYTFVIICEASFPVSLSWWEWWPFFVKIEAFFICYAGCIVYTKRMAWSTYNSFLVNRFRENYYKVKADISSHTTNILLPLPFFIKIQIFKEILTTSKFFVTSCGNSIIWNRHFILKEIMKSISVVVM